MEMNLLKVASFEPDLLQSPSAWLGHLPLAQWVMHQVRPDIFVELGTHHGHSYFSFCKAVQELDLPSKCSAVDTWSGDEHAVFYGDEVFSAVNAHHEKHYASFSRLLRMTFDEAVEYFEDGSIDLLLIDGMHTYKAVRHDFDTWLPKLAPGAVVMFHDTNVRERNFGVWKLWIELQEVYPNNIEFRHFNGLGVLQLNDAPEEKKLDWLQTNFPDKQLVINYFASLGSRQLERYYLTERDRQIAHLNQAVTECDRQIAHLNQAVTERDGRIQNLTNTIDEIRSSTSWRVSAPVRWVGRWIRRIKKLFRLPFVALKRGRGVKNTLKKALELYRREGISGIKRELAWVASAGIVSPAPGSDGYDRNDYAEWIRRYDTLTDESRSKMQKLQSEFAEQPLISVVMPTYNPKPEWLIEAIESVRNQIYPKWELCIADDASTNPDVHKILADYLAKDARVKVVFREQNGHISAASNSALEIATGKWIALLDHDDVLAEHALFWVAEMINRHPDAGLIYSDEDKITETGERLCPYFKCDWNLDLFYSQNMISHLGVYRTKLVTEINGFRLGLEGSQDYDLALRCIERLKPEQIVHIPRVLYHWRVHTKSTAMIADSKPYAMLAGERAINEHFVRTGAKGKVTFVGHGYQPAYDLPDPLPLVSIIIPTHNGLQLLRQCIDSIFQKTTYHNYEIIVVDNGSDESATLVYLSKLTRNQKVRVIRDDGPFNYSRLYNKVADLANGKVIALLNNDTEVISPDWLNVMVAHALRPDIGAVGGRVIIKNKKIMRAGILLGRPHLAIYALSQWQAGRLSLTQNFSALSGACLVFRKSVAEEVSGFDEKNLPNALNDVDFCLRIKELGYRNLWTPSVNFYLDLKEPCKNGSNYQKYDFTDEASEYTRKRWADQLSNDPAYSPNLTLDYGDFSFSWPPRLACY
jgi:glycosyltransferase involved in cell wall biosynthesis